MAALTAALYVALFQEEKSARFQEFKDLGSHIDFFSSKAAVYLLHLSRELFSDLMGMTKLSALIDFLATKLVRLETNKHILCKSQVTIFSYETGHILERYPKEYDDSCRQLWLTASMTETKIEIAKVITNISSYLKWKKFGFLCFYCQKYFSGKGSKHRCRKRRSCFACHRPFLQPNTYATKTSLPFFCTSEMEPKVKVICPKCNLSTYNEECYKMHQQKICRWGWFCLNCNQYTFRSKYLKTLDIIKQTHICSTFFCSFCGERIKKAEKKHHLCPIFKLKPPQVFTKLAFLQMNFKGSSPAWCSECSSENVCKFCSGNTLDEEPNIAVILVENKLGHFDSYTFYETDLDLEEKDCFQKNALIESYLPSFAINQSKERYATFPKKKIKVQKTFFKTKKTIMGQIFNFILEKDFTNTTILVNCSESNEPIFFVAELVKNGFLPRVLKQNGRILLVECQEIGLRLIDSQNYVAATMTDLTSYPEENFIYFPRKWNKNSLYQYAGQIPTAKHFMYFDDPNLEIERKRIFVTSFQGQWILKENLIKNTKQKTFLNAKSILRFISASFEMQRVLFNHFEKDPKSGFLHPLNRPLLTFSSFAYQLFLILSTSNLRMINGPIDYNSSKGEIEFASFLQYLLGRNVETGWSPYGQNKDFLPISVPDIYDKQTQTLYYYNGCYIHGHHSQCKFIKNQTKPNSTAKARNMLFYAKMKKLSFHRQVKKIKIIWQCSWTREKKSNPIVRNFIENIYQNPPTYRLDARLAGMLFILL